MWRRVDDRTLNMHFSYLDFIKKNYVIHFFAVFAKHIFLNMLQLVLTNYPLQITTLFIFVLGALFSLLWFLSRSERLKTWQKCSADRE